MPIRFFLPAVWLAFAWPLVALGQTAEVTLRLDDTRNPMPFSTVFYCGSWNRQTGEFDETWSGYVRLPMRDDGLDGDAAAGDHRWTVKVPLKVAPGQGYFWACDSDNVSGNHWLGFNPSFMVETTAPIDIEARSMPMEAYSSLAQLGLELGFALGKVESPRLVGNGEWVLFTHHAPAARTVYLATDQNGWACTTQGRRVTHAPAMMFPGGDGIFYRLLPADVDVIRYKFVVETPDGKFVWITDPSDDRTDTDGNSVATVRRMRHSRMAALQAGGAVAAKTLLWTEVGPARIADLRASRQPMLLFARVRGNPRCEAFERRYLLTEKTLSLFPGVNGYIVEADHPEMRTKLQELGIGRIPAVAYCVPTRVCQGFVWSEGRTDAEVEAFLTEAAQALAALRQQ